MITAKGNRRCNNDGKGAGLRGADRADVAVRRNLEVMGVAAAEHLGGCLQLDVDFHADDGFVIHVSIRS